MAVIAAFKLDDFVTTGETACQTNGAHGGFSTGADHAHHVHGRHQLADPVGHDGFDGRRRTKTQAIGHYVPHGLDHFGMGMANNHWPPGAHIVHVAFVVFINDVSTFAGFEKHRIAAYTTEGTYG